MMNRKTAAQRRGRAILLIVIIVLSIVAVPVPVTGTTTAVDADTYDDGPTYAGEELTEVWIGQEITLVDDGTFDGEFVSIARGPEPTGDSSDIVVTAEYDSSENSVTIETDKLEAGEIYHIYAHGDNFDYHGDAFEAKSEELTAEFRSNSVAAAGSVFLDIESERDGQHINVTSPDLDADELETIFGTEHSHPADTGDAILLQNVGSEESFEANFEGIEMGEYEFVFDVTDSNADDTETITVREDRRDYSFVDVDKPEQGDIATITVEVTDSDTAAVVLGDRSDDFQSAVQLEDVEDEEVVLEFNTHVAASEDAWSVHEDSNANIENVEVETLLEEGEAFPAHRWDLSVGDRLVDSVELNEEYDRDVLSVQERSDIGEAALATAPADADITDLESLHEATVTRTDTVAEGDALILTVEDFGADGAITTLEDGSALDDEGLVVEIEEQDPGPVADPHVWDSSADGATGSSDVDPLEVELLDAGADADEYDGNLHFLITAESDAYDRNLAAGDSYDVTFSVTDDNAYVDDDSIERTADLAVVERDLTWDPIQTVSATTNATATGSTTVAPGTELRATADSPVEQGGFIQMTDVVVESGAGGDHDFAATFDFSGIEPGVRFDLIVEDSYAPDDNYDVLENVEFTAADEPAFDVTAQAPTTAAVGDTATLAVTVENTGSAAGTSNYSVVVDGEQFATDELELAAGESVDRSYEFNTSTEGNLEWEVSTDHDTAAGTLSVGSADGNGTAGDEADEGTGSPDEGDGTPGFGVVVAAVALLVAAALALRRE